MAPERAIFLQNKGNGFGSKENLKLKVTLLVMMFFFKALKQYTKWRLNSEKNSYKDVLLISIF